MREPKWYVSNSGSSTSPDMVASVRRTHIYIHKISGIKSSKYENRLSLGSSVVFRMGR